VWNYSDDVAERIWNTLNKVGIPDQNIEICAGSSEETNPNRINL
jgi:hypothetical protein